MSIYNDQELPIGFGMALARNLDAMRVFTSMDEVSKQSTIERSRHANSKQEMDAIVSELTSFK